MILGHWEGAFGQREMAKVGVSWQIEEVALTWGQYPPPGGKEVFESMGKLALQISR